MKENWKIERLNFDRDYESFRELSTLAFGAGTNLSEEMHRWAFAGNPYNGPEGHLLFVLKDGDRIIASDALLPAELYMQGRILKVAHSVKSMTHPDYRGQGIFRIMTENSVAQGKKAGVQLILGLANAQSYGAYQKFGWPTLYEKDAFVRPIRITNLLYKRIKSLPLSRLLNAGFQVYQRLDLARKRPKALNLRLEVWDHVPPEIGRCWEKYKDCYEAVQVRDFRYLDYRYNQRPDQSYTCLLLKKGEEIAGFSVLRIAKVNVSRMVSMVEFFTDPHDKGLIASLAYEVLQYCYGNAVDYAVVSTGGFGSYREVLSDFGCRETPRKPRNNMAIAKDLVGDIDVESLKDYRKWHISQGEGDTELDL